MANHDNLYVSFEVTKRQFKDLIGYSRNDNVEYVHGDLAIARYLARSVPEMGYYGDGNVSTSKIDGWMDWASIALVTTPYVFNILC